MESLIKYRPDILLQREVLEEWQEDLQKLLIIRLFSGKWNARYPIQWLQQETEWVVINNNNSTEIL